MNKKKLLRKNDELRAERDRARDQLAEARRIVRDWVERTLDVREELASVDRLLGTETLAERDRPAARTRQLADLTVAATAVPRLENERDRARELAGRLEEEHANLEQQNVELTEAHATVCHDYGIALRNAAHYARIVDTTTRYLDAVDQSNYVAITQLRGQLRRLLRSPRMSETTASLPFANRETTTDDRVPTASPQKDTVKNPETLTQ